LPRWKGKIAYFYAKAKTMERVQTKLGTIEAKPAVRGDMVLGALKDVDVLIFIDHNTVDASYLKGIKKLTRFADTAIAGWLHISTRTLRSYDSVNKVFDKKLSEQVVMMRAVFEKGKAVFGNPEAFDTWLDSTNFFFDGKKPTAFLDTTSGLRYIFDRLTAMEYGDNV
jgi:uncharacterized protein (DUF2384 family)